MYKIIIWADSTVSYDYIKKIENLEIEHSIYVLGCLSNNYGGTCINKYRSISLEELENISFDYCFASRDNIINNKTNKILDDEVLIPFTVFDLWHFDFNEYIEIRNSAVSIISANCWGGLCYHTLGMKFLSPFINMFLNRDDFNRLLKNFNYYISLELQDNGTYYDGNMKREVPIGKIGDIQLFLNHYTNFDEAKSYWYKRKARINKDNMVVVSFAEKEQTIYDFEDIPYNNKIIFTGLDIKTPSSYKLSLDNKKIYEVINDIARGYSNDFNLLTFLNHKNE